MNVVFFVPDIHRLPTGGNIYNRKIMDHLEQFVNLAVRVWPDNRSPAPKSEKATDGHEPTLAIMDSLWVRNSPRVTLLSNQKEFGGFVLLVHYLSLLDPRRRNTVSVSRERKILDEFDGFVVTSQYSRSIFHSTGISDDKMALVRPGLGSLFRTPASRETVGSDPRMLTVSNLLPGKGLMEFVHTLEHLSNLRWTWSLVGTSSLDQDYSARLQERIQQSTISERVRIHGALPERAVLKMYDSSDFFVLPSHFENSPLVIQEAMARGLPVVAYSVGGIPERVSDSKTGYLIQPGDRRSFSDALKKLIVNRNKRLVMGRTAKAVSRQFPSWKGAATKFHRFLGKITEHLTEVTAA